MTINFFFSEFEINFAKLGLILWQKWIIYENWKIDFAILFYDVTGFTNVNNKWIYNREWIINPGWTVIIMKIIESNFQNGICNFIFNGIFWYTIFLILIIEKFIDLSTCIEYSLT